VALRDHRLAAVYLTGSRALSQLDGLRAEAHRAAEILDFLLLGEQVDHRIGRLGVHLGRVRPVEPADVAGELRDGDVHPEADAEVRDLVFARHSAGEDLPLPASRAEPTRHEHAVDTCELGPRLVERHVLGVDPAHVDVAAVVDSRVLERLVHREVRVVELHVLPDERDLNRLAPCAEPLDELVPLAEIGLVGAQAELLADQPVESLLLQPLGDEVDVGDVDRRDNRLQVDVGKERDLVANLLGQRLGRAADEDVRMDTDAAQLVDRVLRRLRLQLTRIRDERDERHVDVEHVLDPGLAAELADRLQEGLRLDIAHGAADLGDDDVGGGRVGDRADPRLDLVRDVRDHLHRRAEVLALALLAQHAVPHGTRGVVGGAGEVLVDEPLVVADVEVGLGAVLGDEDLAVLERAHRPRIDVQVRVELLHLHLQPARLEQAAKGGRGDALAERRDDAAGHEHILGSAHAGAPAPPKLRCL